MTRKKTTKYALLSSVMAMVLSIAMLMGTTFAWFTDTVTSGTNRIIAGNLDVKLYHSDKAATDEEVTSATKLFDDIALWEPGAMVYENFEIENAGSLALKYVLNLKVTNATVVDGKSLADVLKVAVVDGGVSGDRADALAQDFDSINSFSLGNSLENNETDTFGIIIYWQPSAMDNDYNKVDEVFEIDIAVDLFATQMTSERDSFGDTYDAGAQLPVTLIAPITTNSDNTVAAPVILGASTANAVSAADPVYVTVPVGAELNPGTNDFTVKVEETERYSSVPLNPAAYAIAFDIDMPLADDNLVVVPITVHIGSGLNLTSVYHDGTAMIEANTGAADTYVYDATTGNITMYITHCSVFTFVHGADFAVSNFAEFTAALSAAKAGDIIALTADINPTNNFTFTESVTIDLKGYGFVRAKEASGGYGIKLNPGCDLTMMNGRWDMAGTFGDISAVGNTGTCNVYYENVVFTNLDNPTKEELASRPGSSSNLVKTAFKANMQGNFTVNATFENCTFNNAAVEFSGFNENNTYTANFIGCTFNNIGNAPAIKADNYGMTEDCVVNVTDCTFNITVTSNVTAIETRSNGNTVELNLTGNTVRGSIADSNFYKLFPTTSLKFYNETQKFEVVENNTVYHGIAN